jgi:hypothetical protein
MTTCNKRLFGAQAGIMAFAVRMHMSTTTTERRIPGGPDNILKERAKMSIDRAAPG